MSSFCVLRFEKIKSTGELRARSGHNRRRGVVPGHVARNLTRLNVVAGNGVEAFNRVSSGVKMRRNGVLAIEAVLGFSPEMEEKMDVAKWAESAQKWMETEFGRENIGEVSVHMDEKTPHMHVIFFPRDKRGKWNWRGICPGRAGMRNLQTRYAEAVAHLGLDRGIPKLGRSHVEPGVYRAIETAKSEASTVKRTMLADVKSYLGEPGWLDFLKWLRVRALKKKEQMKMEREVLGEAGPE